VTMLAVTRALTVFLGLTAQAVADSAHATAQVAHESADELRRADDARRARGRLLLAVRNGLPPYQPSSKCRYFLDVLLCD
jgi:hypothetical protein